MHIDPYLKYYQPFCSSDTDLLTYWAVWRVSDTQKQPALWRAVAVAVVVVVAVAVVVWGGLRENPNGEGKKPDSWSKRKERASAGADLQSCSHMLLSVCNYSAADSYRLISEWLVLRSPPIKQGLGAQIAPIRVWSGAVLWVPQIGWITNLLPSFTLDFNFWWGTVRIAAEAVEKNSRNTNKKNNLQLRKMACLHSQLVDATKNLRFSQ